MKKTILLLTALMTGQAQAGVVGQTIECQNDNVALVTYQLHSVGNLKSEAAVLYKVKGQPTALLTGQVVVTYLRIGSKYSYELIDKDGESYQLNAATYQGPIFEPPVSRAPAIPVEFTFKGSINDEALICSYQ